MFSIMNLMILMMTCGLWVLAMKHVLLKPAKAMKAGNTFVFFHDLSMAEILKMENTSRVDDKRWTKRAEVCESTAWEDGVGGNLECDWYSFVHASR